MSPRPRTQRTTTAKTPATPATPRKRPSRITPQREIINKLLEAVQIQRGPTSFVQIERSPRGQVVIQVTVHQGAEPGIDSIAAAKRRATEIYDELARKYPVVEYS